MTLRNTIVLLAATLLLAQCENKRRGGASEKETGAIPDSAVWASVDTAMSVATWTGSKPGRRHNGTIPVSQGAVAYLDKTLYGGKFTLDITGIKVEDMKNEPGKQQKLRAHLLDKDFFEADSFPSAVFEITSLAPYDSAAAPADKAGQAFTVDGPNYQLSGNLTIKGVTRNISFPARVQFGDKFRGEAKFNIDRTEWNIKYAEESGAADKLKDQFIYNTVNVGIYIEADLKQPKKP